MGRYLETLKNFEAREELTRQSPQVQSVRAVPMSRSSAVPSDLGSNLSTPTTTPTKEKWSYPSPGSTPATPNPPSLPNGYCPECGGGAWVRETHESVWQCGRCTPLEQHAEFLYVPGGTPRLSPPIEAGWLVVYRDRSGQLCGGADDRPHGTVEACEREAGNWTVFLTDGQRIPLSAVRAVTSTYPDGRIRGGWEVRSHGYDGNGPVSSHR